MQNDISVAALCLKLEQKLMEVWNNELTLERYRKVLAEFTVFAGNSSYSQSLGADFLIARFTERGGLVSTDEHSRKEETYFRCMRMLAEYHNFGCMDVCTLYCWAERSMRFWKNFCRNGQAI